jgi:hypothetical protein
MKQITILICLCIFLPGIGFSQYVPMGMKYQAVARDTKGQILADQELQRTSVCMRIPAERNPLFGRARNDHHRAWTLYLTIEKVGSLLAGLRRSLEQQRNLDGSGDPDG